MYDNTVVQNSTSYTPSDPVSFDSFLSTVAKFFSSIFSTTTLGIFYVLLGLIVVGLITLILWILVRMYELRQEAAKLKKGTVTPNAMPTTSQQSVAGGSATSAAGAAGGVDIAGLPVENATWKHIRERLLSDNTSDWKLAVIEGDIYMDKLLDNNGFHGDTTGDKLKQITPDRLPSIQIAWEVHKIRNRIAHDGAAFVLTQPEARRLLSYYEIVYTDLKGI
jgi:hypothetical protein